jgi:hypothetical protein
MAFLDVGDLVNTFSVGPIAVERKAAPTLNAYGEFVPGAASTIQLNPCAIHTASGRNLDQLPEADRNRETIEVYTRGQRLYTAEDNQAPDVVIYQSRRYKVTVSNDFIANGGVYFALAVLESQ